MTQISHETTKVLRVMLASAGLSVAIVTAIQSLAFMHTGSLPMLMLS